MGSQAARSDLQEGQQGFVECLRMRHIQAMRCTAHTHHLTVDYGLVCAFARAFDGHDRIGVTMDHQHGHGDLFQVAAEVGGTESVHAGQRRILRRLTTQGDGFIAFELADAQHAVRGEKPLGEGLKKSITVLRQACLEAWVSSGVSGPSGLSADCIRQGGTAAANTTLCKRD